jgi:hypothetical protein
MGGLSLPFFFMTSLRRARAISRLPDTSQWGELIQQLPVTKSTELRTGLILNSSDYGCYEAVRRCLCNPITHGIADEWHHTHGDLTDINYWKRLKANYGKLDFIISSYSPLHELDYILLYGWNLARRGILIGADDDWFANSKVVPKLPTPLHFTLNLTNKKYPNWKNQYYYARSTNHSSTPSNEPTN